MGFRLYGRRRSGALYGCLRGENTVQRAGPAVVAWENLGAQGQHFRSSSCRRKEDTRAGTPRSVHNRVSSAAGVLERKPELAQRSAVAHAGAPCPSRAARSLRARQAGHPTARRRAGWLRLEQSCSVPTLPAEFLEKLGQQAPATAVVRLGKQGRKSAIVIASYEDTRRIMIRLPGRPLSCHMCHRDSSVDPRAARQAPWPHRAGAGRPDTRNAVAAVSGVVPHPPGAAAPLPLIM